MARRLTDNITSLYIQASNSLRGKSARKKIVAYVESYDDVSFWSHILGSFETDKIYFQVMLPSNDTLAKGKKVAMMAALDKSLGENMIACVDSDYDYLLQGATSTSRTLIESPYVLHTYAYAIENYQCYAESLHDITVKATLNDTQYIDFPAFFKVYSRIIRPLFVWNIWFYRTGHLSAFSINDFNNVTKLGPVSVSTPTTALEQLSGKVIKKIEWLEKRYPDKLLEIRQLSDELYTLGVDDDNAYMFIQGHHLKEQVTLKVLIPVCSKLRREREAQIKALALHETQYQNELTSYRHSGETVESILRKADDFESAPTYAWIERDIKAFIEMVTQSVPVTEANDDQESVQEGKESPDVQDAQKSQEALTIVPEVQEAPKSPRPKPKPKEKAKTDAEVRPKTKAKAKAEPKPKAVPADTPTPTDHEQN